MTLTDVLGRFQVKHGPDSNGNYTCYCPVCDVDHKDTHLKIKDGYKAIIVQCGHEIHGNEYDKSHTEEILRRVGLTYRDLMHDDGSGQQRSKQTRKPKADSKASAPAPVYKSKDVERKQLVATYVYEDEYGNDRFHVERWRYDSGKKTFMQCFTDANGQKQYKGVSARYGDTLYKLRELQDGIRKRKPVFIVEGEKDVENMARIGYVATCNVGGCGQGWKPEYNHWFRGADVVILADNDPVRDDDGKPHLKGQRHAKNVADSIRKIAARVRLVDNLTEYCAALPEKGDISDLIEIEGDDARNVVNSILRNTETYDPEVTRWWESAADKLAERFEAVEGYGVSDGRIIRKTEKGMTILSDFVALPTAIVTKDDGQTMKQEYVIEGWDSEGARLPTVQVSGKEFDSMSWVREYWDLRANVYPGNLIRQHLAFVMSKVGVNCSRWTEYTHTGWRKVGGKWCFLYHGGAIGAEGVSVNLGSALKRYSLDCDASIGEIEGAGATLRMMDVIPKKISISLLATVFLAPLREFMEQGGVKPSFALWLLGGTGTKKTTSEALALSHFGDFGYRDMPASFRDTSNSIMKKAFILKDMPIVVDDFHPVTSQVERKKMTDTAQALSRAFGDNASRGRMASDLSLQESMPPRGVAIMSGEDLPAVGDSGVARYYIVNVKKDDIKVGDALSDLQEMAHKGYMRKSMTGFIKWIAKQADTLPEQLRAEFNDNRRIAIEKMEGVHNRAPETVGVLMTAYGQMLMYMMDVGLISYDDVAAMNENAWSVIVKNSQRQSTDMRDERPSVMFTGAIQNMLLTGAATVASVSGAKPDRDTALTMVGYADSEYYYFLPDPVFKAVHEMYSREGMEFPLTKKMLWKQLKEDGVITQTDKNKTAKAKRIGDSTVRLLWIPRATIDGTQTMIELDDKDVPEELKK